MDILSTSQRLKAIRVNAHCLLKQSERVWERRGHPMQPVVGHPKQAFVIRGSEITSVDRRLSCP